VNGDIGLAINFFSAYGLFRLTFPIPFTVRTADIGNINADIVRNFLSFLTTNLLANHPKPEKRLFAFTVFCYQAQAGFDNRRI